jgi:hypothetical protein
MSCSRATRDTDAPGAKDASTTARLNGRPVRGFVSMISCMDTTLRCPSAGDDYALDQGREDGGGRTLTTAITRISRKSCRVPLLGRRGSATCCNALIGLSLFAVPHSYVQWARVDTILAGCTRGACKSRNVRVHPVAKCQLTYRRPSMTSDFDGPGWYDVIKVSTSIKTLNNSKRYKPLHEMP